MKWERYGYCSGKGDDCDGCPMEGCGVGNGGAYFVPKSAITTHMRSHNKLRADLTTAHERIVALEDDLAINKSAYETWYKRCLEVTDERDAARAALRPFAEAHTAAVTNDHEWEGEFYGVDLADWAKAAALAPAPQEDDDDSKKAE